MNSPKKALYLAAPLLSSFALSGTALAQSEQRLMLEEVIVTAQKREESLQDAPISIAAFNQEALKQQGIGSIDDLQGKVPSLNLTPFPTQNTSLRIFIRGIGAGDIQVTQDPAVGIYIDQVYIGRSTGLGLELADLAQIEVLRGTQGTLFGRNAIGGAINMTTIKPETDLFAIKQEIGIGNRNLFRSKTSANVPITDNFALRAVYLNREKDGFVKNDGPGADFMDSKDEGGKLDFLWEPNDEWSVRYAFDFARSEFVSPTFQAVEASTGTAALEIPVSSDLLKRLSTKDELRPSDTNIDGHSLIITRQWEDMTFKSITAYRDFEYKEFTDLESGSQSSLVILNSAAGADLIGQRGTLRQNQFSQELQLLVSPSESFDYVLGLYYFDEGADSFTAQSSQVFFRQPDNIDKFDIQNEAWAIFGQGNWTPDILDQRLTLTLGLRYTEDDREATRTLTLNPDPVPDTGQTGFTSSPTAQFDNISYTGIVSFAATDDINTYLKLATGYKSGGYNIRASNEAGYSRGFDEEIITTWELGLKSELFDQRVRLNAAAYFSVWDDIQLNLNDSSTPADVRDTNVINAGEGEISGLELDITALLYEGLTATITYALQDSEFTKVVDPDDPTLSEDDFVFTNVPDHQYTIGLNYDYPLSFGELNANLNYNWVDDRLDSQRKFEADIGRSVIESYGLLGAYIGLSDIDLQGWGSLDVSLWGKNLTDEEYFTSAPTILQDAGAYAKAVTWGEPLSYGIDVVLRFSK